ncbi:transcriptional regulator [Kribbella sandramycini]|uniref:Transcriptional regulator n=1 Tax=Kribbella sandramycini TaxID=60450 RepID=A0A7Y4L769_9ACTN|nr:helix-turn-helix transcriptional regulator [Kribbella sandramycini]MBB6566854.1 transcriptional regulator with XRE-family HTH domain [Kribbella sandramycini]NOL44576.1 transcriptional regulator [Kribbella sandramycini]
MELEAFAAALRRVRQEAGLTYRELADQAHYSHAHLVRAAGGKQLPSWPVAVAFLTGCGVPAEVLPIWRRHWEAAARDPQDVGALLRTASTPEDLGAALTALTRPRSLRSLERLTGVPRATLQSWLRGGRVPRPDRLDQFIQALGATRTERLAFSDCVDRLAG